MTDPHSLLRHGWRESTKTINGVNLHVVEAGAARGLSNGWLKDVELRRG